MNTSNIALSTSLQSQVDDNNIISISKNTAAAEIENAIATVAAEVNTSNTQPSQTQGEEEENPSLTPSDLKWPMYSVILSHLFVSLNYLVGVSRNTRFAAKYTGSEDVHQIDPMALYCMIFTFLWVISAIVGYKVVSKEIVKLAESQQ